MAEEPDPLVVWALGSLYAALLVVALVIELYVYTPLGEVLADLNTVLGIVLYLALWALTVWTTRATLQRVSLASDTSLSSVLVQSSAWGAVTGVGFLLAAVLFALAPRFLLDGELVALGFVAALGAAVALVVGALVGCLFGVLTLGVARLAATASD